MSNELAWMKLPVDDNGPVLEYGTPTGLSDSNGQPILIGCVVRQEVTGNKSVHGEWCEQRVRARGLIPVLSYIKSKKGQVFPEDYTATFLSDCYDAKYLLFMSNTRNASPLMKLEIISSP